jgi:hypothetical protein
LVLIFSDESGDAEFVIRNIVKFQKIVLRTTTDSGNNAVEISKLLKLIDEHFEENKDTL